MEKDEAFDNKYEKNVSGNEELVPALASALQRPVQQSGNPAKKTASGKPKATQDKLPSTSRCQPSLA